MPILSCFPESLSALAGRKGFQAMVAGLVASVVALVLWATPVLRGWEYVTWSWRARALSGPSPSTEAIKVILIDQASLDWAAKEMGLSWPWPREVYEPVLDFCRRGGAKVIAFDMLYSEPSAYMASDDMVFGEAIRRAGNVVTAFFLGQQAGQASVWPEHLDPLPVTLEGLSSRRKNSLSAALTETGATFPIAEVASAATLMAGVKDVPDKDGIFRRAAAFRLFDGKPIPQMGLATYLVAGGPPPYRLHLEGHQLVVDGQRIPLDSQGQAILRYRGPSGTHETLSAAAVIQSELRLKEGGTPVVDPEELRGYHVFFGVSAPGLKDQKGTPISGDYPGVEIHATFLDNLLEGDFIRDVTLPWVILVTLLLAVAAGGVVVHSRTVWGTAAWGILFLAIPVALGFLMYRLGWWWPIMVQEVAVLGTVGLAGAINYATEGRQKRFIKSAFRQYLSGDVIEQIIKDPSQLKLGGERRELTMFFSDLQGFSSFSEKLGPEALIALLNEYLTDMCDIIMKEGGTVDKYVGDAIVAFWNAPLLQADHAARACRAAVLCQRKLDERREEFRRHTGVDLRMRIGIHTGEVVVGNMGSRDRFNYTVLGDAANLASRLEGANKAFGTYLMVSEETWRQARAEGFVARETGAIMVVGRKAPVIVYEVLGLSGEPVPDWLDSWRQVMLHCRAGQWKEALALLESFGDDPLASCYRTRCSRLVSGELSSWDGVWKLLEK